MRPDVPPPRWLTALMARRYPPGAARESLLGDLHQEYNLFRPRALRWPWFFFAALRVMISAPGRRAGRFPRLSWMDVKLGFRMLVKYPGLTIVGGLAMAFAIAVGAAAFEIVNQMLSPRLPLHHGDRIVGIRLWHAEANGVEEQALYDFTTWRGRLESIEDLGVFRTVERNLIGADTTGEPITTAETTASAFTLAGVPARLGRPLVDADEDPGAPPVMVIGHDVWQARFAGDPGVIGRSVQVGEATRTVVGVMPEGFGFPRSHSLWIPLRLGDLQFGRRQGPWVFVFGRLAPGASIESAQAELTALGAQTAAAFPDTHEHIRPQVRPYAEVVSPVLDEIPPGALRAINLFFVMLLVLVCANVALLLFARAAARERELAVRTALGASRGRIAGQLFAEALALGSVALVAGLWAAGFALRSWFAVARAEQHGQLPFWYSETLAPITVLYAGVLMVLGAAIAGFTPALKATGRGLEARLRQASAGGSGLGFGGVWTAVIVAQVALTLAFPASAYFIRDTVVQVQAVDAGFAAGEYVAASLEMDPDFSRGSDGVIRAAFPEGRYRTAVEDLWRRLSTDPAVAGVTVASRRPLAHHPPRRIEIDAAVQDEGAEPHRAGTAAVGLEYFDVLHVPMLAGRAFTAADLDPSARTAIVNASFVQDVLGGRHAVGVRLRELPAEPGTGQPGPWLEIVGVAPDLGMIVDHTKVRSGYYRAATPGALQPSHLIVHARGPLTGAASRIQEVAAAVDPSLRLHDVAVMGDGDPTLWMEFAFLFKLVAVISGMATLLSFAAIYAAMSFAVSRRTREIGIRAALGASGARIVLAVLARPLVQIGIGVVLGVLLTAALSIAVTGTVSLAGAGILSGYAALMLAICLLPSFPPARRVLRVDPTEALRAEA